MAMVLGPVVQRPALHRPLAQLAALSQASPSATPLWPCGLPLPGPAEESPLSVLPQAAAPSRPNESANAASVE